MGFFYDSEIRWWEALILLAYYAVYVIFMRYNKRAESYVKSALTRCSLPKARVEPAVVSKSSDEVDEPEEPFDISWPSDKGALAKIMYIFLLPINVLLWVTLPDMRRQEKQKFVGFCFLGSIIWIGFFR